MRIPRKKIISIVFESDNPSETVKIDFNTISQGDLFAMQEKTQKYKIIVEDYKSTADQKEEANIEILKMYIELLKNKCLDEEAKQDLNIENVTYEEAKILIEKLKATFTLGQ
jgi:hypothetical protein